MAETSSARSLEATANLLSQLCLIINSHPGRGAQRDADLAALESARARLARPFTLAVVGEFSSGKSYLLNALLGKVRRQNEKVTGLLTVDINPSTATITELEFSEEESATALYPSGRRERVPIDQLSRFVAVGGDGPGALHDATLDDDAAPTHVTVRTTSSFLRSGFVIADTPGLASLNPAHRRATLGYLPRADAVLYLIDTQQPFTEGDAAFLGLIGEHVRTIFIVQTKIDLWRMPQDDGRQAWESARDRIVRCAELHAPTAQVFAVSSRNYAIGQLDDDAPLRESSGFPALLCALDRSLAQLVTRSRIQRALALADDAATRMLNRLEREQYFLATTADELQTQYEESSKALSQLERKLADECAAIESKGLERAAWAKEQGTQLADELVRALGSTLDVSDIENIRDRGKLHALIDAVAARVLRDFADTVAERTAQELEDIARDRPRLALLDAAALALGGEPGSGAWTRDVQTGIRSTIVLGAIGGPAVTFIHAVAHEFAAHGHGQYMKRELSVDLRERFFPQLATDVIAFVRELAERIDAVYKSLANAIQAERKAARSEALDPIEQARALVGDDAARRRALETAASTRQRLETLRAELAGMREASPSEAPRIHTNGAMQSASRAIPFDADVYQSGLNPRRWRVVILGALRRGKSSLINAIAGSRILRDEGAGQTIFPIHVRFGPQQRAYALIREGTWHEIPLGETAFQSSRLPILIEVPWKMPRELVLVHAPAFDSGNPKAEEISLTAAAAASEVLALFSRQLSERELALYGRVAELKKPMLFAHTIADNENASERRTVVDLASRYLQERNIAFQRVFTVSALDYHEAGLAGRAPSPWNELGALRETLAAHTEEHMNRLAREEREKASLTESTRGTIEASTGERPPLLRVMERLLRLFGE